MFRSNWNNARKDVQTVQNLIGEKEVISISPDPDGICLESWPCRGHKGVEIAFKDGETIRYKCSSVSIGCIQKVVMGETDSHFEEYAQGFTM